MKINQTRTFVKKPKVWPNIEVILTDIKYFMLQGRSGISAPVPIQFPTETTWSYGALEVWPLD